MVVGLYDTILSGEIAHIMYFLRSQANAMKSWNQVMKIWVHLKLSADSLFVCKLPCCALVTMEVWDKHKASTEILCTLDEVPTHKT